jgi:uncharacterized protein YceH (UPF0502 family)
MKILDDVQVRVLGALIEKEMTTPEYYPLSLNALVHACNQTSNREPVMQLEEAAVSSAIVRLREHSLVRATKASDARVPKFSHLLAESLQLERRELAVLDVMLLRGAQTIAELKSRASRMVELESSAEVEQSVNALIAHDPPLVVALPRRPGQKEVRYAHLLSGEVSPDESIPTTRDVGNSASDRIAALETALDEVRNELADVRRQLEDFRRQFE